MYIFILYFMISKVDNKELLHVLDLLNAYIFMID